MTIRPGQDSDIPAIIALLRLSLGETLLPKSEKFWRWKHQQNPFGASYVLLAEEGGSLIGLRAFMRWQWRDGNSNLTSIRAVDTATHPEHQGKGIFKKLTLQQINDCRTEGVQFVFNTPNSQSMPGYLKMGWELQGKMPMKMQIRNLTGMGVSKFLTPRKYAGIMTDPTPVADWFEAPLDKIDYPGYNLVHTDYTAAYLKWRYADCPVYNYTYLTDNETFLLTGRMKYQSFFKEFRITDLFSLNQQPIHPQKLKKQIQDFARAQQAAVISMSGQQFLQFPALKHALGPIPVQKIGPHITLRSVAIEDRFGYLLQSGNWAYSTGDLELF